MASQNNSDPASTTPNSPQSDVQGMGINQFLKDLSVGREFEEEGELSQECKKLLLSLPKEKGWRTSHLYLYQNFWCQPKEIQAILTIQKHFEARDTDVILVTIPKSGTTWLKAMVFAITNRFANKNHLLLTSNPHDLVPFLEYKLYTNNILPDLSRDLRSPRTFATHIPYASLPESMKTTSCKIVYLCRNPLDTFISSWQFLIKARPENLGSFSMEEWFDMFCKGVVGFGPFWGHMLGYWKESKEKPDKVLFLKYEDMKEDEINKFDQLKRLAAFLGCPFSVEEERDGVVEEISRLCSFDRLKELEVNKSGTSIDNFENKSLFRKGGVGDWVNYLTPSMAQQLSGVMEEKLSESGLYFKLFGIDTP